MITVRRILMIAYGMSFLSCIVQAIEIPMARMKFNDQLILWDRVIREYPGIQDAMETDFRATVCSHIIGCAWYFALSVLLILVIRRLKISN